MPPQALSTAIVPFSRAAGVDLVFDGAIPPEVRTTGVAGTFSLQQGLNRLLAGTGFSAHLSNAHTVRLEKAAARAGGTGSPPPGSIALETIEVQGGGQAANGPGVGYVATRSATATKSDTPIVETPQSISVVTRKQIDDQQPESLNEALRYTAGVVAEPLGVAPTYCAQTCSNNILIRGFPADLYVDGLKATTGDGMSGIDPYLLNRAEVLNGPASVLYGQASPGGVVNMGSKLPTTTPINEMMFQGGSYGRVKGAFDLGGPVDKDGQFLYRLTGVGFTEGSQVDFVKNQEVAIAPALTWKPGADTSITLLGKYINQPAVGDYVFVPASGTVLPNPNGKIPTSFFSGDPNYNTYNRTLESIGYQFEHRLTGSWTVQQNFRYEHEDVDREVLLENGLAPDQKTLARFASPDHVLTDSVAVDNRLSGKVQTGPLEHSLTFGVDYRNLDGNYSNYGGSILNAAPPINVFAPVYYVAPPNISPKQLNPSIQTQAQTGLYSQDQISIDRWRVLIGVREDFADGDTKTTAGATGRVTDTQYSQQALTWRTGLVYLFDNGIAPYASYSTSFQPQAGLTFDGQAFVPTTGQQYEVGVKYQPPGWKSFVTLAAYDLLRRNVPQSDPIHAGYQIEVGEQHARGIEFQAHANLTANLDLIGSYTYMDSENVNPAAVGGAPVNQPTQGLPRNVASLWANYAFHDGPLRGLGLGGGVRYTGESYGLVLSGTQSYSTALFTVPDFTLFDAMLNYDFGEATPSMKGVKFQINATNLFDRTYVASCTSTSICYYGLRRAVYATIKYDW